MICINMPQRTKEERKEYQRIYKLKNIYPLPLPLPHLIILENINRVTWVKNHKGLHSGNTTVSAVSISIYYMISF